MKTIEIEDQSGKAAPRGTSNMSRTTQWRLKKAMQASISSNCETPQRKKKLYSCADCDGLITDPGHGQFRGKRYCPKKLDQIPYNQWLAEQRKILEEKKLAKAAQNSKEDSKKTIPTEKDNFEDLHLPDHFENTQDLMASISTLNLIENLDQVFNFSEL